MSEILVVEDELLTRECLKRALKKWGHTVHCAESIAEAKSIKKTQDVFDLVILDRMLPDGDGIKLCAGWKRNERSRKTPIVILTSKKSFHDEVSGYHHGADLYLKKPIQFPKLKGYLEALLDRVPFRSEKERRLRCGKLCVDVKQGKVSYGEHVWDTLPKRMFDLIYFLASHQGRIVDRESLLFRLWKDKVKDKEVDVAISRLRKHLSPIGNQIIRSVRGKGYAIAIRNEHRDPSEARVAERLQKPQILYEKTHPVANLSSIPILGKAKT